MEEELRDKKAQKEYYNMIDFVANAQQGIPKICPCGSITKETVDEDDTYDYLPGKRYFICKDFENDGLHFRQPWVTAIHEEVERLKERTTKRFSTAGRGTTGGTGSASHRDGTRGNVVTDLLKELAALPKDSQLQGEGPPVEQALPRIEVKSHDDGETDNVEILPQIRIAEPTTETFPATVEGNWSQDEDDMNKEEDEIEEGELVEKRGVPSKVSTVKGRRQNVGLVNKSKKKTIVQAKDLKFGGRQGQQKKTSVRKL
ncbi:hypothetical protein Bca52824_087347 [Brassica carinata]|uniref:Uncharacterized protein n=1 Tax=Brassica carinata TaxID=52824 RepID=A0A8X7PDG4_BRACI|nr:hypothetical protein Bca52824_087347 [Brassica carinata]